MRMPAPQAAIPGKHRLDGRHDPARLRHGVEHVASGLRDDSSHRGAAVQGARGALQRSRERQKESGARYWRAAKPGVPTSSSLRWGRRIEMRTSEPHCVAATAEDFDRDRVCSRRRMDSIGDGGPRSAP